MSTADDRQATDYLDVIVGAYEKGKQAAWAEKIVWEKQAEMDERRYGTGGRQHYGDPRQAGDIREGYYQGGPVSWEREQKELEAGQ